MTARTPLPWRSGAWAARRGRLACRQRSEKKSPRRQQRRDGRTVDPRHPVVVIVCCALGGGRMTVETPDPVEETSSYWVTAFTGVVIVAVALLCLALSSAI